MPYHYYDLLKLKCWLGIQYYQGYNLFPRGHSFFFLQFYIYSVSINFFFFHFTLKFYLMFIFAPNYCVFDTRLKVMESTKRGKT